METPGREAVGAIYRGQVDRQASDYRGVENGQRYGLTNSDMQTREWLETGGNGLHLKHVCFFYMHLSEIQLHGAGWYAARYCSLDMMGMYALFCLR